MIDGESPASERADQRWELPRSHRLPAPEDTRPRLVRWMTRVLMPWTRVGMTIAARSLPGSPPEQVRMAEQVTVVRTPVRTTSTITREDITKAVEALDGVLDLADGANEYRRRLKDLRDTCEAYARQVGSSPGDMSQVPEPCRGLIW